MSQMKHMHTREETESYDIVAAQVIGDCCWNEQATLGRSRCKSVLEYVSRAFPLKHEQELRSANRECDLVQVAHVAF